MSFAFSLKTTTKRKSILSANGSNSASSALLDCRDVGEDDDEGRVEAVKAIGAGGVLEVTDGERALAAAKKLVIPLITTIAEQDNQDVVDAVPSSDVMQVDASARQDGGAGPVSKRPNRLLLAKVDPTMDDSKRFKSDVMNSAEDINTHSDAYRAVPVEEFGAALLRGMGWREEDESSKKGSGKSSLFDMVVPREKGLGLGAKPRPPSNDGPGTKKLTNPKHYAAAKAAASGGKQAQASEWQQKAEQKLREQVLQVGDCVWLRVPSLAGRRGRVVEVEAEAHFVQVCLEGSDSRQVRVWRDEAVLLSADELVATDLGSTAKVEVVIKAEASDMKAEVEAEAKVESWFYEGIRVRITSKKLDSSACVAYLQKGTVLSVDGDGRAAVLLDGGHVLQGVSCRRAETVLPQVDAACLVVAGRFRGTAGTLLSRDKGRGVLDVQPAGGGGALRGLALDEVAALQ